MIRKEKTDNLISLLLLYNMFNISDPTPNPADFMVDGSHLRYVKYAAGDQIYKILSSDALFAFNSELSNDWTENTGISADERNDTYITCFYCDKEINNPSDVYSQWTGYCSAGGVAIEFYFGQNIVFQTLEPTIKNCKGDLSGDALKDCKSKIADLVNGIVSGSQHLFDYSLMSSDKDDGSEYILYPLFPLPVSYVQPDDNGVHIQLNDTNISTLTNCVNEINKRFLDLDKISLSHYAPYIKHFGFHQEQEARLAFVNRNNALSGCIRFLGDKKVPYIMVKFGNQDDNLHPCNMLDPYEGSTLDEKAKAYFQDINNVLGKNSSVPIIIPQGYNQEEVYNAIEKQVLDYNLNKKVGNKMSIICQGHLPITKITLAPTSDKELLKKKLEIFCKSKYWLRNVEICTSKLPYNMININHT